MRDAIPAMIVMFIILFAGLSAPLWAVLAVATGAVLGGGALIVMSRTATR